MLTTIFLGIKFLYKPVTGGADASESSKADAKMSKKTRMAMIFGCLIGWVCGFTGSGRGILMLTVFTVVLGYKCEIKRLNRIVGCVLMILGIVTILIKIL